jgi:diacylglycerol kinase (ATP)
MSPNVSTEASSENNMNPELHRHSTLGIGTQVRTAIDQSDRKQSLQVATNLFSSFYFAWQGLSYAFRTLIGVIAIGLSIYLKLSPGDLATICLTSGAVLALELINTALESVVDLTVGQTYDPLAKIAKDCAAASVLISAMVALGVALVLLLPPLISLIFI